MVKNVSCSMSGKGWTDGQDRHLKLLERVGREGEGGEEEGYL
jgi:hypothetical protein